MPVRRTIFIRQRLDLMLEVLEPQIEIQRGDVLFHEPARCRPKLRRVRLFERHSCLTGPRETTRVARRTRTGTRVSSPGRRCGQCNRWKLAEAPSSERCNKEPERARHQGYTRLPGAEDMCRPEHRAREHRADQVRRESLRRESRTRYADPS